MVGSVIYLQANYIEIWKCHIEWPSYIPVAAMASGDVTDLVLGKIFKERVGFSSCTIKFKFNMIIKSYRGT